MNLTPSQQRSVNDTLRRRDIDFSQSRHLCCIRIHSDTTKESDEHAREKFEQCLKLRRLGRPYLTEAWNSRHTERIDVLDLIEDEVVEIETNKNITKERADMTVRVERV